MIKHCVFVNFRTELTREARTGIFVRLAELVGEVNGMVDFTYGPNRDFEKKSPGYSDGFVATFTDAAALAGYANYPKHVALGNALVSMCEGGAEGLIVFDIESD